MLFIFGAAGQRTLLTQSFYTRCGLECAREAVLDGHGSQGHRHRPGQHDGNVTPVRVAKGRRYGGSTEIEQRYDQE